MVHGGGELALEDAHNSARPCTSNGLKLCHESSMAESPDIYCELQFRGYELQGQRSLQLWEEKLCCLNKPGHRRGDESNDATGRQ